MTARWETNIGTGVCSVQFDRKDIAMNKLLVTGLESKMRVYDLRYSSTLFGTNPFPILALYALFQF